LRTWFSDTLGEKFGRPVGQTGSGDGGEGGPLVQDCNGRPPEVTVSPWWVCGRSPFIISW